MLLLLSCIQCIFFSIVVSPNVSLAQQGPEESLRTALAKIKQFNTLLVLSDFIAWDLAYKKDLDTTEREYENIHSPEDYRLYMYSFLSAPGEAFMRSVMRNVSKNSLIEFWRAEINSDPSLEEIKQRYDEAFRFLTNAYASASFDIGTATITGNSAKVPIVLHIAGNVENESIELIKRDNTWLATSMAWFLENEEE